MPKDNEEWTITLGSLNGWGGLCPAYFDNSYPYYGNKNHASEAIDVDLIDPNVLSQGPASTDVTNGNEVGALKDSGCIVAITRSVVATNVAYGIGKKKLYSIADTTMSASGTFPHTITGSGVITGCDVCHYKGNLFYSYNDSALGGAGVTNGNIGKCTISTFAFDDTYWTVTASGTALENAVHFMLVAGDDVLYITNGRYVATLSGTTAVATAIDFWEDSITVALAWNGNRVKVGVNRPNISGSNFNTSAIYNWDGYSPSWEGDPIELEGQIGAMYVKNGVEYVWWKDAITDGGYNLGYVSGLRIKVLRRYSGSLPNQAQIGEYDGHIAWLSSGKLVMWGAKDADVEYKMFQYCQAEYSTTIGAFAAPFGTPLISSSKSAEFTAAVTNIITSEAHGLLNGNTVVLGTSSALPAGLSVDTTYYVVQKTDDTFKLSTSSGGDEVDITGTGTGTHTWYRHSLSKFSTTSYSVDARYKTLAFKVSGVDYYSQIDLVMVECEPLSSGAACDFTLTYNKGATTLALDQFAYSATDATTRRKIMNRGPDVEDFRLDVSWANATTQFKIRSIQIKGHYKKDN